MEQFGGELTQSITVTYKGRTCKHVLVGQDGILRGGWQPPLFNKWISSRSEEADWQSAAA